MAQATNANKMEYRFLGRTGLRVSVLSLGAWITYGSQVDEVEVAYQCMKKAYECGCNFFDNAEIYADGKAEEHMGEALQRMYKDLNIKRKDLVVTTKLFWGGSGPNDQGLSRKHIVEGMDASLERLKMKYVDVVYCHRPDAATPLEETVRAMDHLIQTGRAFYWGTSEWSSAEILSATLIAQKLNLIAPVVEQPQYSMLHRTRFETEYEVLYKDLGYGTTIWSPLACGLLSGKYSNNVESFPEDSRLSLQNNNKWLREQLMSGQGMNGLEERNLDTILTKVDGLRPIAKKLDCTLAQLALAWCAKNKNVSTVITGASKVQQVEENFKALAVIPKLTDEVIAEIEAILKNKPQPIQKWRRN